MQKPYVNSQGELGGTQSIVLINDGAFNVSNV